MEFKTKFDIDNLVVHKFESFNDPQNKVVYAIMETFIQRCYSTTQIFYDCRIFNLEKTPKFMDKNEQWRIAHGRVNRNEASLASIRLREDELIPCPQEIVDIILSNGKLLTP